MLTLRLPEKSQSLINPALALAITPGAMTVSGANIGIGTTTPAAKLDVVGGNVNLENSTATSGNILKGGTPFLHNYGNSNTFLGLNAGNFTMTGAQNRAIGLGVLNNNTTGAYNTASGYEALHNNTTGQYNTAIGYLADACEGCGNLSNCAYRKSHLRPKAAGA